MKMLILILAICAQVLLSSSFASAVDFQKLDTAVGYSIENKKNADNFLIKPRFPENIETREIMLYLVKAAGEECLTRGFKFFDFTNPQDGVAEGFCFSENIRKAFAIKFEDAPLKELPPRFIVEDLMGKTLSKLQVKDQVLAVDGKKISSVSELKSLAFATGKTKKAEFKLEIKRDGKDLKITEPLAELKNGAFGPDDLADSKK